MPKKNTYTLPSAIIDKYSQVLVNYALNSGQGVKPDEVVQLAIPDVAKDLGLAIRNAILKAGAHPIVRLIPSGFDRDFYNLASDKQLTFFPRRYIKSKVNLINHNIRIIADTNPQELKNVDPQKIFLKRNSNKPMMDWLTDKESQGQFTWTVALYATQAKAQEVGLSLEDYWQQIIKACFLDEQDPIAKWHEISNFQKSTIKKLNHIPIRSLHITGDNIDLHISLGLDRAWKGGGGRNIPSFEIFTSPDWHGTHGHIFFNQPLYRYGNIIRNISLEFKKGKVVKAHAEIGNKFLQEMIKTKNADKVGEFSLTDNRTSRITHFMAETLYDENVGGPFGNTHIALGMAYKDCYKHNPTSLKKRDWKKLGFNDSPEHTDIVSTTDRTVTATLEDNSKHIIYTQGQFTI